MTPARPDPRGDRWLVAALGGLGLLAWLLCHPYQGLFHDANLYALQALARLEPDSLSHDVFLSHGSQDRFTLFSPLYAGVIALVGLDRAAALLTLLSQGALCVAAWQLARAGGLPRWAATAGLVLLVALPCEYGPLRIFACIEPFLTPRMAAEAFTLGALAAALRHRRLLCMGLLLIATLLHPVMALAGLATLIAWWLVRLWTAGAARRASALAAVAMIVALGLAAVIAGQFDGDWLGIVQTRSPYLFLSGWPLDDGIRALTGLLPLIAGALTLEPPLRRAASSVLLAAAAGWLVTLLGAALLHLVFVTQLQTWRTEWLVQASGALLLPWLLVQLWRSTPERRSAALLLVAALIFRTESYAVPIGLGALALLRIRPLAPRHARLVLSGAIALATLAVLWRAGSDLQFTDMHYLDTTLPIGLRRAMSGVRDGLLLGALSVGALWLSASRRPRAALALLLAVTLVAAASVVRFTLDAWLTQAYPASRVASFDAWRVQVPPRAEVLFDESPLSTWALLRRPNYLSGLQTSGVVFSRGAALELKQRAEQLAPVIDPANFLQFDAIGGPSLRLDAPTLLQVCRLGVIDYLVTRADLDLAPSASEPPHAGSKRGLKLYRCADPR